MLFNLSNSITISSTLREGVKEEGEGAFLTGIAAGNSVKFLVAISLVISECLNISSISMLLALKVLAVSDYYHVSNVEGV